MTFCVALPLCITDDKLTSGCELAVKLSSFLEFNRYSKYNMVHTDILKWIHEITQSILILASTDPTIVTRTQFQQCKHLCLPLDNIKTLLKTSIQRVQNSLAKAAHYQPHVAQIPDLESQHGDLDHPKTRNQLFLVSELFWKFSAKSVHNLTE